MDAFHAAYARGKLVRPPEPYVELILVPAVLHIEPLAFRMYPPALRERVKGLLLRYLAAGQGMTPMGQSNE